MRSVVVVGGRVMRGVVVGRGRVIRGGGVGVVVGGGRVILRAVHLVTAPPPNRPLGQTGHCSTLVLLSPAPYRPDGQAVHEATAPPPY